MTDISHMPESQAMSSGLEVEGDLTCAVFSSFDEISDVCETWDLFIEAIGGDIFLTFDSCRTWWKYYGAGRDLKVYIFRNNKGIVGILPMFCETLRYLPFSLRVVKIVGSDYTLSQFSLPIDPSYFDVCIKRFLEEITPIPWHILSFGPLAGMSETAEALKNVLPQYLEGSDRIIIRDETVQTYFKLQPTWKKHLAALSKSQRRGIVRKIAALEKYVPNAVENMKVILADVNNVDYLYKSFVEMHQAHWRRLGKLGHFGDWPRAFEFHNEMALSQLACGRLRLMCVQIEDEVLGYEYAYKFSDKYYAILNSRTEEGVYNEIGIGSILFSEQVKMAISENVVCIDAMRGRYDYKLRLGGELFTIKKLSVIRKGILNSCRVYLYAKLANLIDLIYYRVWFRRLAPKCPFKRGSLWKIWIRTRL